MKAICTTQCPQVSDCVTDNRRVSLLTHAPVCLSTSDQNTVHNLRVNRRALLKASSAVPLWLVPQSTAALPLAPLGRTSTGGAKLQQPGLKEVQASLYMALSSCQG